MLRFITLFMLLFGVFSARADDLSDLGHAIDRQDCPTIINLIKKGLNLDRVADIIMLSPIDTSQLECWEEVLKLDSLVKYGEPECNDEVCTQIINDRALMTVRNLVDRLKLETAFENRDCPAIISLIDRGISVGESNFFESMHDTNQHECLKQILQLDRYRNDTELQQEIEYLTKGHPLPDYFLHELKQCQFFPGHDSERIKTTLKTNDNKKCYYDIDSEIKGWKDDKCIVSLNVSNNCWKNSERHYFLSSIPKDVLEKISTTEDIAGLIDNLAITDYDYQRVNDYYWFDVVAGSLKFCNQAEFWSPSEVTAGQFGITWGISYRYASEQCIIDFVRQIRKAYKIKDMSVTCVVPQQKIPQILAPYKKDVDWITSPDSRIMGDGQYRMADVGTKIFHDLQQKGYCTATNTITSTRSAQDIAAMPALINAIENKDCGTIVDLVKKGVSPDVDVGGTPLMMNLLNQGQDSCVDKILELDLVAKDTPHEIPVDTSADDITIGEIEYPQDSNTRKVPTNDEQRIALLKQRNEEPKYNDIMQSLKQNYQADISNLCKIFKSEDSQKNSNAFAPMLSRTDGDEKQKIIWQSIKDLPSELQRVFVLMEFCDMQENANDVIDLFGNTRSYTHKRWMSDNKRISNLLTLPESSLEYYYKEAQKTLIKKFIEAKFMTEFSYRFEPDGSILDPETGNKIDNSGVLLDKNGKYLDWVESMRPLL